MMLTRPTDASVEPNLPIVKSMPSMLAVVVERAEVDAVVCGRERKEKERAC